jgi:hypothetical protein
MMSDLGDLFPGFASQWIDTAAGRIFMRTGGEGRPLLLLHGHPQTNVMWHRVAPALVRHFALIIPDLPGYGWSDAPPSDAEHAPYTKRAMAKAMRSGAWPAVSRPRLMIRSRPGGNGPPMWEVSASTADIISPRKCRSSPPRR